MNKVIGHLKTINKHKYIVTKLCFRCHLYKQGILHDLSKYSICELKTGFKYYQGYRSPIDAQKEDIGYSLSCFTTKEEINITGNIGWIMVQMEFSQ